MRWRRQPRKETYRDGRKGTIVARADGGGGVDKIAVLGGVEYAVQVQHPDGAWLRIAWDGAITAESVTPQEAGP